MPTELEKIALELQTEFNQIRDRRPNDLYVNSLSGDDTFPGSYIKPFKTIQKALDVAGSNEPVIHLASGYYNENLNITTSNISIESLGFKDSYIQGNIIIGSGVTNLFIKNLFIKGNTPGESVIKDNGSFGRIKFSNVSILHELWDNAWECNNSQNEIEFANCFIQGNIVLTGIQSNKINVDIINSKLDGLVYLEDDKHFLNISNCKFIRSIEHSGGNIFLNNIESLKNSIKFIGSGINGTNIITVEGKGEYLKPGTDIIGKYIPPGTTVIGYNFISKELTLSQPLLQDNISEPIEMFLAVIVSTSDTGYLEIRNCSFKNSDWATYGALIKSGNCNYRFINVDRKLELDTILNGTNDGQGVNATDINSNLDNLTVADLFVAERTKRLSRVYNPGAYIPEEKLVTVYNFYQGIPSIKLPNSINDEIEGLVILGGLFPNSTGYILRKAVYISTLDTTGYSIGDPVYGSPTGDITLLPSLKQIGIILSIGPNAKLYINLDGFISNQKGIRYGIPYLDGDKKIPLELIPNSTFDLLPGTIIYWNQDMFDSIPALPGFWAKLSGQLYLNPASPFNGKTLPNVNGDPTGADTFNNGKVSVFLRGGLISGIYQDDDNKAHTHNADVPEIDPDVDVVENAGGYGTGVPIFTAVNMALASSGGIEARPKNTTMVALQKMY